MKIKREIKEKGQVVIPKDIREFLGLDVGIAITFEVEDDKIIIKKEKNNNEYLKDFLNISPIQKGISIKELKKSYEKQYEKKVR